MGGTEDRQRIIQEYVPGKQITLAHVISNASEDLCKKIGMPAGSRGAIGILTLTPSETAIIAGDVATKAADIDIVFVDRFSGSLVISGDNAGVTVAVEEIVSFVGRVLGYSCPDITKS